MKAMIKFICPSCGGEDTKREMFNGYKILCCHNEDCRSASMLEECEMKLINLHNSVLEGGKVKRK